MIIPDMHDLLDQGWTVTWLKVDGKYVVTATRLAECHAGIGGTSAAAWDMLRAHAAAARG